MRLPLSLSSMAGWRTITPCIPIPGWAIAHPGSTSFPNPLRVRFDGVNSKMEDRGIPQDPQIGLQSRGIEAQDRPASDQSGLGILHPRLASFLDDDAQSLSSGR